MTLALVLGREASPVPARPESRPRAARATEISLSAPEWSGDRIKQSIAASDDVVAALHARGVGDVPGYIQKRLAEVPVDEAEARAFFDGNASIFGGRSFDQSRSVVDQLLRIHKVRQERGIVDPSARLRYMAD